MMKRMYVAACFLVCLSAGLLYGNDTDHSTTMSSSDISQVNEHSQVPVGQYKRQVIIEGKWGSGPEEFGVNDRLAYYPTALAVNSKGEVYIQDIRNNRIKKYSADGKFQKNIPVPSLLTKEKKQYTGGEDAAVRPYYRGIHVAFDSQDNLYYCFNKGQTGHVYKFINDLLVQEWDVPEISQNTQINADIDGNMWIYLQQGFHYNITSGEKTKKDTHEFVSKAIVIKVIQQLPGDATKLQFKDRKTGKMIKEVLYKGSEGRILENCWPILKGDKVIVRNSWRQGNQATDIVFDVYDQTAHLVSRDRVGTKEFDIARSPFDVHGNIYQIDMQGGGSPLRVIKWIKQN